MKRALVWFKNDLRLSDNEVLFRSIEQEYEIIPVYCLDPSHFKTIPWGLKKTGNFRAQFLMESLEDLDNNLRKLNTGLLVVKGNPVEELSKLITYFQVEKIFTKDEIAHEELQVLQQVKIAAKKLNCSVETYASSTLYHPDDLGFEPQDLPDVFTKFRVHIEKSCHIRSIFPFPTAINSPKIPKLVLPSLSELDLEEVIIDSKASLIFKGGETEAFKRLNHYFFETKAVQSYKETRNELMGSNYSSKFSAWLSMGCISAKSIYLELKRFEQEFIQNESTYWLYFELLWRDYFYFMMKKYKHHFFLKGGILDKSNLTTRINMTDFQNWMDGKTGNDFIDANMLELKQTGFMSNRGRQNVASFLHHELELDWRLGASYFEQQLIDYDVSSNWCNWAYIAGVGNDPRGGRKFNIEKQVTDYDFDKKYRIHWL